MNILVVDDNEADQFLSEYAIKQFDDNIVIQRAYDGQEALNFLANSEQQPEIIFLDINMPGMDGFEFLEQFQKERSDKPPTIVMLTSSLLDDDNEKCMAYPHVKEVVPKPLNSENLANCFEKSTRH